MNALNQLSSSISEVFLKEKKVKEFRSHIMKSAWSIRKEAAARLGCPVHQVLMSVCLKMAYELATFLEKEKEVVYDLMEFSFENTHAAGKFADGWKYRQATGMIEDNKIVVKLVDFGYVRPGKMENRSATVKAHIAFEAPGYAKVTPQSWGWKIPAKVKKIVGQTWGFGEIFKKEGFTWDPSQKAWIRR